MSRAAVQQFVVDQFEAFLADLRQTIRDAVDQFNRLPRDNPGDDGATSQLSQVLRDDWCQWMAAWRAEKLDEASGRLQLQNAGNGGLAGRRGEGGGGAAAGPGSLDQRRR